MELAWGRNSEQDGLGGGMQAWSRTSGVELGAECQWWLSRELSRGTQGMRGSGGVLCPSHPCSPPPFRLPLQHQDCAPGSLSVSQEVRKR